MILTLIWGFNWSVLKFGVSALPPVWFRFLGLIGSCLVMYGYARVARVPLTIPPGALWRLVALSIPNMLLWFLLGSFAISLLPSGRAAILGYTMPVWAALIGVVFLRERLAPVMWGGVLCALLATLLLVAGEWQNLSGRPVGALLMLTAAVAWAIGNHMMRRLPVAMPTAAMTFWMMAFAAVGLLATTTALEYDRWAWPHGAEWLAILYNAVLVLGLGNVAWFSLARTLPPVASGLSGMLVPVLGVFSGMFLLGEEPHWRDWLALVLIVLSLASAVWPSASRSRS